MNFDFSDDQKLLQQQAQRFLRENCPPSVVRGVLDGGDEYEAGLWQQLAEQGWPGLAIPAALGGSDLGYLELCVTAEELGRALAPVPMCSSIFLCAEALLRAGSEAQKRQFLPELASGALIGCFAFAEGLGFPGEHTLRVECRDGRLHGEKWPVADGSFAQICVVLARDTEGAPGLYLADLRQAAVTRSSLESVDRSRPQARLRFEGAACEPLGMRSGWGTFMNLLERASVLVAFEQIGGADACLEMAVNYAQERKAFGRPIGSFQAIKHKLADMYVKNQLARANAYYGAWALSADAPELPLAAATARVSAVDAFEYAARECLHIHGGMGFTWEMDCHLYYRRSRTLAVSFGSSALWKRRITDELERQQPVSVVRA